MALKALMDSLDGISEDLKKEYTKLENGKYLLQVETIDGYALEDVTGLKSAYSKEQEARRGFESRLKAFGDLDVDVANNAIAKYKEMENWTPEEKVKEQIEMRVNGITEKYQKEATEYTKYIQTLETSVQNHLVDNAIMTAFAEHNVKSPKAFKPFVKTNIKVEKDDNGQLKAYILDDKGLNRISQKQGVTDHMDIMEYVGLLKEDADCATFYEGSGVSGSGAKGGASGGDPSKVTQFDEKMTVNEKYNAAYGNTQSK